MNYWDIFRKDFEEPNIVTKSNVPDTIFKFIKVIAYMLLFVLVFGGVIVSRATLQMLTDELHYERLSSYSVSANFTVDLYIFSTRIVFL